MIPGSGNHLVDMYEDEQKSKRKNWRCRRCGMSMPANETHCDCEDTNIDD